MAGSSFSKNNSHSGQPSGRPYRFYHGLAASGVANCLQAANFLSDRFTRKGRYDCSDIGELYRLAMNDAFSAREAFLVTGAPHASAYYPRDFAWFYPDVLDPDIVLDSDDAVRRVHLLEKSARLMLEAVRARVITTTIIPVARGRYIGANYFSKPSDTLLGIQAALEQIIGADERPSPHADMSSAVHIGRTLLGEYRDDLKNAVADLARRLEPYDHNGTRYLLCDVSGPRSAATDTRAERLRFVTNASVYATFQQSIRLGVITRNEIENILGRALGEYKSELLQLFGRHGFIQHSLDCTINPPAASIALDFVNVKGGFWNLDDDGERALFAATTDHVLTEERFRIPNTFHFFVSVENPLNKIIHRIATPAYQGRSCWPTFNVEFADRMLDYDECAGGDRYRSYARAILRDIHAATETHGGYQELLSETGAQYRTWAYRGAVANSWFPRFLSVWRRVFGTPLLGWAQQAPDKAVA